MTNCVGRTALAAAGSALLALTTFAGAAGALERQVREDSQQAVALTIYNDDLALIRDERRVDFIEGVNELAFIGVSGQIRPETVVFTVPGDGPPVRIIEQNFDFDLLTPRKLLEKSLGRTIRIVRVNPATGEETTEEAVVLSTVDGVLLRIGDRIETLSFGAGHDLPGRLVFDRLPENLRAEPTLILTVDSEREAPANAVLSYLSGGLSWKADYVARLADDEKSISLQGWVTLTNTSGTAYRDARLQLVAGDVNRVREDMVRRQEMMAMAQAATPDVKMAEEALFDYHLYSLDRPTTILNNQTKQVSLLTAPAVQVRKEYVLDGHDYYYRARSGPFDRQKVGVWLELENSDDKGLGVPLPKGVVRVYKDDSKKRAQFVGEDRIDHTPEGDEVRLRMGQAFDVTADRRQTDYQDNRSRTETAWEFETAHEIVLKNAKDEAVMVRVAEPIPGDWTVLEESVPHVKESARTAAWEVAVPAKGETRLTYRVRVVFPR